MRNSLFLMATDSVWRKQKSSKRYLFFIAARCTGRGGGVGYGGGYEQSLGEQVSTH